MLIDKQIVKLKKFKGNQENQNLKPVVVEVGARPTPAAEEAGVEEAPLTITLEGVGVVVALLLSKQ